MDEDRTGGDFERLYPILDRHWRTILVAMWLLYSAWILFSRWAAIKGLALGDTDDNLRLAEVRAWLGGQGWFDLRQHRFDPVHGGANIHWSRLVDLPLAGMILLFKPIYGTAIAERIAVAMAPLLPLLLLLFSSALTVKRLVGERSWPLPVIAITCAYSAIAMFNPLRIDHHGWQLAFLALGISGVADPPRARGGAVTGIAAGLSLAIGLEMIIYLALLGGSMVLLWVWDRDQRRRMMAYAGALAASTALAFLLFASNDNRQAVCDALSPVWLSDAMLGGAVMLGLAWLKLDSWKARLGAAIVGGAVIAVFHALAWPNCLQRLEGVSPEATRLWLDHVREARPFYRHGWKIATVAVTLPITALLGWGLMIQRGWKLRDEVPDLLPRSLAVALVAVSALALQFWQMRATPAAQMMALPGTAALIVLFAAPWLDSPKLWHHAVAVVVILLGFGALVPLAVQLVPEEKSAAARRVSASDRQCPSLSAMAAVNRQPRGIVFTFIDLGPRLIVTTHHDTVAGPYHRNDQAIADVMTAFRGDEAQAKRIINNYGSNYVLVCPDMSTATIFMAEAPKGFYAKLMKGPPPPWLRPVDLGRGSPFRMWKVVR